MRIAFVIRSLCWLLLLGFISETRADGWTYWAGVPVTYPITAPLFGKLASDGTNLYYATLLDGVYRSTLADREFHPMPMAGYPLWSASNSNGFAVWNLGVASDGTVVISGSPINITSNNISPAQTATSNTSPLFYYWDEASGQWVPSTVTGKTYPYTTSAGNFTVAPDGALWTCSGFASYAYRSTNGGRSYVAFDINARVPTNYLPMSINGQTTFGKIFSILATPQNHIVVGTETGGFLQTTNNGTNWTSLDPNFASANSTNPLGRVGNAMVLGIDRYANVMLQNTEMINFPAYAKWSGVKLIGYKLSDGSCFPADYNLPAGLYPPGVLTTPAGDSFTYMVQNSDLVGGIYRSSDGKRWHQFNDGIDALTYPFAPGITNAVAPGNSITAVGTTVFAGDASGVIYSFDTTPPPIINHPVVGVGQNLNLLQNGTTNIVLSGADADGDALAYEIVTNCQHGILSGTPPDLIYTPTNGFVGLDLFWFTVTDGASTSGPVAVNIAVNPTTNPPPQVTLLSPTSAVLCLTTSNLFLAATATDSDGIRRVDFDVDGTRLVSISNAPYTFVWTNPPAGTFWVSARAVDTIGARTWSQPVRVTVTSVEPKAKITAAANNSVIVSWPLDANNTLLESASTPTGPWSLVSTAPLDRNYSEHAVTLTNDFGNAFFRLFIAP